ncbi:MAG TPA: myo-inositol-1-phosphate synthase [Persephonella sp.]|uniref:Myo-inositol-1-phosphate synthase n=1 Tax=Persephonella marina (strain DSM 14350 / EX-H1) TaxID=123214 RepID=C0QSN5_PERMH|nr:MULTISPECIES: inositol-3-phosphate synthase [Persephonella]ACO04181.1 myo-inositol-1-phosphate synthase [Persephonella marina EX-H1]HCB69428.1 myo-inositol-1-phosphate synthase [Persephonella sp.]
MKLWLFGLYGIVATTAVAGDRAVKKGITDTTGLVSSLPVFKDLERYSPLNFDQFGGHEIRALDRNLYSELFSHWEENQHFDYRILKELEEDLKDIKAKKGTALNCGSGVLEELKPVSTLEDEGLSLEQIVERIEKDILEFKDDETVAVNVASTEPVIPYDQEVHGSLEGFERAIKENRKDRISASMIYAYVSLKNGIPYGNFTPSAGSGIPALKELAEKNGVPHAGNDGKTGETLVKTTLAPMFAYRNLKVLGWMGYNILGDLDGKVLSHKQNKESKVVSKDKVVSKILGYEPYTITEINYFPSLQDNKTAFDFIHYQGFLGTKMKFYFTWDAVDAIVAAPLVLDIARFLNFAKKKGVKGVVKELAFFFKSPMDTDEYNTHKQFETLVNWYRSLK